MIRKTDYYLEYVDVQAKLWLNEFTVKLAPIATTLGVTTAEMTQTQQDNQVFSYAVDSVITAKNEQQERVKFKNLIRDASADSPTTTYPALPTAPLPPTATPKPGVFARIKKLVKKIKAHPAYTKAIGEDLGIEGSVIFFDMENYKPKIKVKVLMGSRKIEFSKSQTDGVNIYSKITGSDTWTFLARDTNSPYIDNRQFSQPTSLDYMVKGVVNDDEIGLESDTVTVVTR